MVSLENRKGCAVFRQAQGQAPGMLDHSCCNADDLLHHGADAPTFGGMTYRAVRTDQGRLADGAQDVVSQHRQGQHQIIGGAKLGTDPG